MIEYPGNEFSERMSLEDAMEKFQAHIEEGIPVAALHVGTMDELYKRRMRPKIEDRLESLEMKFEALEPKPRSETIHIPTDDEIQAFMVSKSPCKSTI